MCFVFAKTKVFENSYVIEINSLTPKIAKNWRGPERDFDIHPQRNYFDICLNGNEKEDKIKLDFVQLQMRDLLKSKDTILGIHIVFGNQSKYWTMVETFNICLKEKAKTYVLVGNDFWFYNYFPKPITKQEGFFKNFCGFSDCIYEQNLKEEKKENNILQKLKETPKTLITLYVLLSVLFLVMCGIKTYSVSKTL